MTVDFVVMNASVFFNVEVSTFLAFLVSTNVHAFFM